MKPTTMKKIEIEIPEGKEAKWVDGVLTLVDEEPKDITERVKTFEDACNELGEENVLVQAYRTAEFNTSGSQNDVSDVIAYLKLRIIVAALNEGWEPKFKKGEYRYFPCFCLHTKEKYDNLDNEEKESCILHSDNYTSSYSDFVNVNMSYDTLFSYSCISSRLALRTRKLAAYAGRQFTEEWADFVFKSK